MSAKARLDTLQEVFEHTVVRALFGGVAAGLGYSIGVVDDGLVLSEALAIALAALAGAGFTAVPNGRKP